MAYAELLGDRRDNPESQEVAHGERQNAREQHVAGAIERLQGDDGEKQVAGDEREPHGERRDGRHEGASGAEHPLH